MNKRETSLHGVNEAVHIAASHFNVQVWVFRVQWLLTAMASAFRATQQPVNIHLVWSKKQDVLWGPAKLSADMFHASAISAFQHANSGNPSSFVTEESKDIQTLVILFNFIKWSPKWFESYCHCWSMCQFIPWNLRAIGIYVTFWCIYLIKCSPLRKVL